MLGSRPSPLHRTSLDGMDGCWRDRGFETRVLPHAIKLLFGDLLHGAFNLDGGQRFFIERRAGKRAGLLIAFFAA